MLSTTLLATSLLFQTRIARLPVKPCPSKKLESIEGS
jgi:hypothetical protein